MEPMHRVTMVAYTPAGWHVCALALRDHPPLIWTGSERLPKGPKIDNTTPTDAATRDVSRSISPDDRMHIEGIKPDGRRVERTEHYFDVGRSALEAIGVAMAAAGKRNAGRILDLPCGHGRVLRFLRAAFPDAELTACDVLKEGVDHCAEAFGATPVYSHPNPARVELPGSYDLIWCGSLLTHLPEHKWDGFLRLFFEHLEPGGLLVFTTHGRWPVGWLRSGAMNGYGLDLEKRERVLSGYDSSGFGFVASARNTDYGFAFSSPAWVCSKLAGAVPDLKLASFGELAWGGHQDVVGCSLAGHGGV